eukprot:1109132-Pleurochrysis_carterae.AAC.3
MWLGVGWVRRVDHRQQADATRHMGLKARFAASVRGWIPSEDGDLSEVVGLLEEGRILRKSQAMARQLEGSRKGSCGGVASGHVTCRQVRSSGNSTRLHAVRAHN